HEAEVVPALAELSAGDTAIAMAAWAARAAALRDEAESTEPARRAHLSPMLDGRWRLGGSFDAGAGAVVAAAVGSATRPDAAGAATPTLSAAPFAALASRAQRCRHPGCDRPVESCEAHHVIPVLAGGATCLANLVLKCSRHHHTGHKPGWSETLRPDGTLVITD